MSTDTNIQQIQAITEAAKNGTGDFVRLDFGAKEAWVGAIESFIAEIDRLKGQFDVIREYHRVTHYLSAVDTKTALGTTGPDQVQDAVNSYRDYLVALKTAVEESYNRIHRTDQA